MFPRQPMGTCSPKRLLSIKTSEAGILSVTIMNGMFSGAIFNKPTERDVSAVEAMGSCSKMPRLLTNPLATGKFRLLIKNMFNEATSCPGYQ